MADRDVDRGDTGAGADGHAEDLVVGHEGRNASPFLPEWIMAADED
jgi:hypothetical protein